MVSDFQKNNPQFPVPPRIPQAPNNQMNPNPYQGNLSISSSEASFSIDNRVQLPPGQVKRVGMDTNTITSNYQNGNLDRLQNNFPDEK